MLPRRNVMNVCQREVIKLAPLSLARTTRTFMSPRFPLTQRPSSNRFFPLSSPAMHLSKSHFSHQPDNVILTMVLLAVIRLKNSLENKESIVLESLYYDEEEVRKSKETKQAQETSFALNNFRQSEWIDSINKNSSMKADTLGCCHALTLMWFAYECMNKNFTAEMKTIQKTLELNHELDRRQERVLQDIINIQNLNKHILYVENTHSIHSYSTSFFQNMRITYQVLFEKTDNPDESFKKTLDFVLSHPNQLIYLILYNSENGHALGITATYLAKGYVIKCFDANVGEATFYSDRQSAQKFMKDLLFFYESQYQYKLEQANLYEFQKREYGLFWKKVPPCLPAPNEPTGSIPRYPAP